MGFALKYRETSSQGSFVAWGIGFRYQYNSPDNVLDVIDDKRSKPLLYIDFDQTLSKNPFMYIENLEKTTQIKALMFTGNMTADLSDSFDDARLPSILEDSARLARFSFDLRQRRFHRFGHYFCESHGLKRLQIRKMQGTAMHEPFYIGKLSTPNNNAVSVRACSLHRLLKELGDATLRDLITAEYGHPFQSAAYDLLAVSSKLSTISHVLDEHFVPAQKIRPDSRDESVSAS